MSETIIYAASVDFDDNGLAPGPQDAGAVPSLGPRSSASIICVDQMKDWQKPARTARLYPSRLADRVITTFSTRRTRTSVVADFTVGAVRELDAMDSFSGVRAAWGIGITFAAHLAQYADNAGGSEEFPVDHHQP